MTRRLPKARVLSLLALIVAVCTACATPPRPPADDLHFARLKDAIMRTRHEHIWEPKVGALAAAAVIGLYEAGGMEAAPPDLRNALDPLEDLRAAYKQALARGKATPEQLTDAAIARFVRDLDKLSGYMDANEIRRIRAETNQPSAAIGVRMQLIDGHLTVLSAIDGGPAAALDLRPGDRLVSIDGEATAGMTLDQAARRLRGAPDSRVTLGIVRKGKAFETIATRAVVRDTGISAKRLPNDIGYVAIGNFTSWSARTFEKVLVDWNQPGEKPLRGMVLDLRNNSGGILNGVVGVADFFFHDGLLLYTDGPGRDVKLKFSASLRPSDVPPDMPVVVLVNGQTASGAEMLAALLQDRQRARVVGTTTHGIGTIQTLHLLPGAGALKLTTATMHRPSGRALHKDGVIPDVCIKDGKTVTLDRARLEESGDPRSVCPSTLAVYDKEADDVELRAALDLLRR